ncbi:MAG: type II toxin-antitoxin system VapB family antitoxin [Pyrinomonadaceae bacterium]
MCITEAKHTHYANTYIDNRLMKDTRKATGHKTKREVVEMHSGIASLKRQGDFRKLKGQIDWQGDLEDMRLDK